MRTENIDLMLNRQESETPRVAVKTGYHDLSFSILQEPEDIAALLATIIIDALQNGSLAIADD